MPINLNPIGTPTYSEPLGSQELYTARLQKVVADLEAGDGYDAATVAYVKSKVADLKLEITGLGQEASGALDTIKEITDFLAQGEDPAASLLAQLNAIKADITAAESAATTLAGRVTTLEGTSASDTSSLQGQINKVESSVGLSDAGAFVPYIAGTVTNSAASLQGAVNSLDDAFRDLTTTEVPEGEALYFSQSRVKETEHTLTISPWDATASAFGSEVTVDKTVAGALQTLNTDVRAAHAQLKADATAETTRVNGGLQELGDSVDQIRDEKFNKTGGVVSGELEAASIQTFDLHIDGGLSMNGGTAYLDKTEIAGDLRLDVQHGTADQYASGQGKFLYFSQRWRMYGKSDGSRLVFEYNNGSQEAPNWKAAIPFIRAGVN